MRDERTLAALFQDEGVRLSLRDGELVVRARRGVLTPEVKALLVTHKTELRDLLRSEAPAPPPPEAPVSATPPPSPVGLDTPSEAPASVESAAPPSPMPWRAVLAGWLEARRKRWGLSANELEAGGLDWKETERLAFEDSCRERWGMSKTHANRLVDAAEVVGNLTPIGVTVPSDPDDDEPPVLPINEAQARPLAALPPEQQKEVWKRVVETAPEGKPTAKHVAEEVRKVREVRKLEVLEEAARETVQDTTSWEIRHGDCLEVLPTIARGLVRLAFADPPYNIGIDYGEGHDDEMSDKDFRAWTARWISATAATLTPDGSLWVLINHEWGADVEMAIRAAGLRVRDWITWYESFGVNCSTKFNRTSRRLFHAVKDPERFVFHPEAVTRPSDRQAIYNDRRANPKGKIWDDVWGIKPPIPRLVGNANERIPGFPTQLPLALLNPIVACASDRGDRVLDPFNGSGTTGVAAISMGRRYLGIERSQSFLQRSRQRLLSTQRSFFDVY